MLLSEKDPGPRNIDNKCSYFNFLRYTEIKIHAVYIHMYMYMAHLYMHTHTPSHVYILYGTGSPFSQVYLTTSKPYRDEQLLGLWCEGGM